MPFLRLVPPSRARSPEHGGYWCSHFAATGCEVNAAWRRLRTTGSDHGSLDQERTHGKMTLDVKTPHVRPRPCSSSGAFPAPTWTAPLPSWSAPRASRSGPSPASTTTACSGSPTCPMPAPSPSSRCSGSRSSSCWTACPGAAQPGSSKMARCPTDRFGTPSLCHRALAPGGVL
jgi:hypothetical protein